METLERIRNGMAGAGKASTKEELAKIEVGNNQHFFVLDANDLAEACGTVGNDKVIEALRRGALLNPDRKVTVQVRDLLHLLGTVTE